MRQNKIKKMMHDGKSVINGWLQLPSSFSGGAECLFEMGGAFNGTYLGIAKISNVYNLRYRAGDGQNTVQTATANNALKNVPISDLSSFFDGGTHHVAWDIKPSSQGRIRLFLFRPQAYLSFKKLGYTLGENEIIFWYDTSLFNQTRILSRISFLIVLFSMGMLYRKED